MTSLYDIDGAGTARFHFHPGQLRAWDSERRFVFVFAGTQGGKTSFCPWWLWREITRTARPEPGDNDYLAVTSTFDLFKLKLLPEFKRVFESELGWGRYWSSDRVIELADPASGRFLARNADDAMWGRIILRSAAGGGGLESATARGAVLDECGQDEYTVETWEAVQRRTALHQGRVFGATTLYNLGWTKTEIYDRWASGDQNIDVIQFDSALNPSFPREEYDRMSATMPAWRFNMFCRGLFSKPAGMIYDCWDDVLHKVSDFPIPREWPRVVGIDFGGVNVALVWLAHDVSTQVWYLYRELLTGSQSTAGYVAEARRLSMGENVVAWWGGSGSEDQQRRDWAREGLRVLKPPVSDVESGIAQVYAMLKPYQLKVFESCRGIVDEIGTYRRKLGADSNPTEEIVDKRTFHRLDALRYASTGIRQPAGLTSASQIMVA